MLPSFTIGDSYAGHSCCILSHVSRAFSGTQSEHRKARDLPAFFTVLEPAMAALPGLPLRLPGDRYPSPVVLRLHVSRAHGRCGRGRPPIEKEIRKFLSQKIHHVPVRAPLAGHIFKNVATARGRVDVHYCSFTVDEKIDYFNTALVYCESKCG